MTATPESYDAEYYEQNGQDSDRIALWFYARVVRRLAAAGSPVLDYGCGRGFFVRRLCRHFEASGFDLSPYAREQTKVVAGGVTVFGAPDEVPSQAFELITALHVLEHISDPSEPLKAFHRWLRPGGKLFVVVPNPDGWGKKLKGSEWFAHRDPTHCSLLSSSEWLARIRAAGFDVVTTGTDGLWDPPYVGRIPQRIQLPVFGAMAAGQVALGRVVLPSTWGECLVVTAQAR